MHIISLPDTSVNNNKCYCFLAPKFKLNKENMQLLLIFLSNIVIILTIGNLVKTLKTRRYK